MFTDYLHTSINRERARRCYEIIEDRLEELRDELSAETDPDTDLRAAFKSLEKWRELPDLDVLPSGSSSLSKSRAVFCREEILSIMTLLVEVADRIAHSHLDLETQQRLYGEARELEDAVSDFSSAIMKPYRLESLLADLDDEYELTA